MNTSTLSAENSIEIDSVVFEISPGSQKSGRVYSSRRIYLAKCGIVSNAKTT